MIDRSHPGERSRTEVTGRQVQAGAPGGDGFTYFVVTTNAVPRSSPEHRREKRLPTRLRDGIVSDRRLMLTCQIRDRSKFGARLHLDRDEPLPRTFTLTDAATNLRFTATLMWQRGQNAGVRLKAFETPR